ncbi:MAG: response regulator [Anaerolineaceae bacterium]|nr:response regulator [Anaerolineaceae bacterium]
MAQIMVIDDDEDFASAICTVLEKNGHDVEILLETESAIDRIQQSRPALIILDAMFPENESGGFELARSISRRQGELKRIPILMLTAINKKYPLGFGLWDIDEEWFPVTDFLEKPVDFTVLIDKVEKLLAAGELGVRK